MTFRRLGAVGVVLMMALAAPGAAAAGTAPAPRPEAYRDQPPLAYVSEGRVLVLDGEGNPPVRVRGVADACCVAFSPDGYYVAFERRGDLWVAEHDGSELHRVARSVGRWEWAPDGQALAIVRKASLGGKGGTGIEFVGAEDSSIRETLLPGHRVLDMAWAGLGRRIAVSAVPAGNAGGGRGADGEPAQLFMLEVPGPYGEDCPALCPEAPLSVPVEHPEATSGPLLAGWSPNVENIALWTAPGNDATLGVVSPRGGGITPIAGTLVRRSWVQWSRNGDRLLVVEGTAREAGAPRVLLLCTNATACRPIAGGDEAVADPAWSRSGTMAYVRTDRRELWIANRDGADAHRVAAAGEGVAAPRWLPDTRHLLFVRDGRVWLLDATGGGENGAPAVPVAGPIGRRRAAPEASAREPSDLSPDLAEQLYSVAP
jgi:dipeptidyl aminopeptidase/acylaminoacyl peptidase